MKPNLFKLLLMVLLTVAAQAPVCADTSYQKLVKQYNDLYLSGTDDHAFLKASDAMKTRLKDKGDIEEFYYVSMNECLYLARHRKITQAIKKANALMDEMDENSEKRYDMLETAIGYIHHLSGSHITAYRYYNDALKIIKDDDKRMQSVVYDLLAKLQFAAYTYEAGKWNEKYGQATEGKPRKQLTYLTNLALINFFNNSPQAFYQTQRKHERLRSQHPAILVGRETMQAVELAFKGKYNEAMQAIDNSKELATDRLLQYDMKIRIYQMHNGYTNALNLQKEKALVADTLVSKMIDGNLNELSAEIGLYRMRADKNRAQKRSSIMQTILSVLALVVIGLLVTYNYVRRRSNEKLKQKNEELKEALNMAGEADRMKTEFVRRVSHEIRTPLNAISGFAEIICTPGMEIPDEDKADLIDRIQSNMRAITKIVDELLHVADSESQVSYPKNQTIACNQFLSAILESYRKEANANVELKYTPRVMNRFTIYSNESGLSKVVDNLVQNAVKFTSKGTIELRCEKSLDEQSVVITVTDTGKGIPEDKREKIFEQFYKVDAFQQGIGLGLTMSKQIAQKLGGDLVLDPEYTNGSRFVLTLPIE